MARRHRALPHEGLIDIAWPRERIERFIRAMDFPPFPPAAVMKDGKLQHVSGINEYNRLLSPLPDLGSDS